LSAVVHAPRGNLASRDRRRGCSQHQGALRSVRLTRLLERPEPEMRRATRSSSRKRARLRALRHIVMLIIAAALGLGLPSGLLAARPSPGKIARSDLRAPRDASINIFTDRTKPARIETTGSTVARAGVARAGSQGTVPISRCSAGPLDVAGFPRSVEER